MWLGSFASNIGTWMQTVVLGAFAYTLTGSSAFVGALAFAQLGPLLLLSIVGGIVAGVDAGGPLVVLQVEQLLFSLALAIVVAASDDPSKVLIFVCVLAVGIGNALNAPAWGAVLPLLVGPEDLGAAISLNSTMVNGSRVVGPALGGLLYPIIGAAWIFALNAVTYLAVIGTLLLVRFPEVPRRRRAGPGSVAAGFRAVRQNPVVARVLLTLAVFAVLCLPFVSLFPALAESDLGLDADSLGYGLLYAFGLGVCLGVLSIGTPFAAAPKMRLVRVDGVLRGGDRRLRGAAGRGRRLPGGVRARVRVLRHHDIHAHGAADAAHRRGAGPGHGAVVHGVRRWRLGGRPRLRAAPRRHQRHRRPRHRRPCGRRPRGWSDLAPLARRAWRRSERRRGLSEGLFAEQHGSTPARVLAAGPDAAVGPTLRHVLDGYDALALDLPGFGGASPEPPVAVGAFGYAAAVAPALDRWRRPRRGARGHSSRRAVSVHLAGAYPDRVAAVALTGVPRLVAPERVPAPATGFRVARRAAPQGARQRRAHGGGAPIARLRRLPQCHGGHA